MQYKYIYLQYVTVVTATAFDVRDAKRRLSGRLLSPFYGLNVSEERDI